MSGRHAHHPQPLPPGKPLKFLALVLKEVATHDNDPVASSRQADTAPAAPPPKFPAAATAAPGLGQVPPGDPAAPGGPAVPRGPAADPRSSRPAPAVAGGLRRVLTRCDVAERRVSGRVRAMSDG